MIAKVRRRSTSAAKGEELSNFGPESAIVGVSMRRMWQGKAAGSRGGCPSKQNGPAGAEPFDFTA
jgi:hypothetical protein